MIFRIRIMKLSIAVMEVVPKRRSSIFQRILIKGSPTTRKMKVLRGSCGIGMNICGKRLSSSLLPTHKEPSMPGK